MAEKRMFAKTIIDSDAFLDMPMSSQCLYFHLCMRADDDGFINNPKKIQRMIGASDDDLKVLAAKKFIIPFESGVVVIKHWRIHNCIQNDRYKETSYLEEKSSLGLKDNGAYTLDTECFQNGNRLETQNRLDKNSIEENNNNGDSIAKKHAVNMFFDEVWRAYPKKKGKGQISDAKKRALYEIGKEEMIRCINRYKDYVKGKDDQYVMYGSTFFNSGYVDYLDENYADGTESSDEEELLPFR